MASFLLGDEYASSSSSEEETSASPIAAAGAAIAKTQLLPSAAELFSSDTSGVLANNRSAPSASKRKNEQPARPATKAARTQTARRPKDAPFAPPQLRRPNISTEERSLWNTHKTLLAMQKKARETNAK